MLHVDKSTALAYVEGRLGSEERARVFEHSKACESCRTELELLDPTAPPPAAFVAARFSGTKRYPVQRILGKGGMGTVYEAIDIERNVRIALKVMHSLDASSLFRFKREFRAVQDIHHPNLVTLGELVQVDQTWFFTMELVHGIHFQDYVCPNGYGQPRSSVDAPTSDSGKSTPGSANETPTRVVTAKADRGPRADLPAAVNASTLASSMPANEALLRPALRQLASGLIALHRAGKVHRDLKPTNALVTPEGRVVLLDFGLIVDSNSSDSVELAGTASFMSPEQARCESVGPAADWYAFGTMLFLALTGVLPFRGSADEILDLKKNLEPLPPRALVPSVPADLNALCVDLLRLDPDDRPDGAQVYERLQGGDASEFLQGETDHFVGRQAELSSLSDAFFEIRAGVGVSVFIEASSGQGKSALARRFADIVAHDALVLQGRCYERESVSYKAMDDVIDALTRHLMTVPEEALLRLLPTEIVATAAIFPVLRRVRAIADQEPAVSSAERVDPQARREAGFQALRTLFVRLAQKRPLVIFIDDLQWADTDSIELMDALLRPPEAPRMLLVATLRTGPTEPHIELPGLVRHIRLGALSSQEAAALAKQICPSISAESASLVADAAGGHPLFIEALALRDDAGPSSELRLEDVLWSNIKKLPDDVREVLEALSVASHALRQETLARAVTRDWGEFMRRLEILRGAHLVRTAGTRRSDKLEVYHARIADAVVAHLSEAAKRQWHGRLALALEWDGRDDPEILAAHFREAGNVDLSVRYFRRAAGRARRALAFDRAARLYGECLAALPSGSNRRRSLSIKRADALAHAGRGIQAADAYLVAAKVAETPFDTLELKRRAAEQLLGIGELGRGLVLVDEVMSAQGLRFTKTRSATLLSIAWGQARRVIRGYRFKETPATEIPPEQLLRIDTCLSASTSLAQIDTLRGFDCQTQHLFLALQAGEPIRVTQALAFESVTQAALGAREQTEKLQSTVYELEARVDDPYTHLVVALCAGIREHVVGNWREAQRMLHRATKLGAISSTNVSWELSFAAFYQLSSLGWVGDIAELRVRVPLMIAQAESRGNRYAATLYRVGMSCLAGLAEDAPERTESQIIEASTKWLSHGYYLQNLLAAYSRAHIHMYCGKGREALALMNDTMRMARRGFLLRPIIGRIDGYSLRARAALATIDDEPRDLAPLLRSAANDTNTVLDQKQPWALALGYLLQAAIAYRRERVDESVELLGRAAAACRATNMELFAQVADLRRGQIIGGDAGDGLIAGALSFMKTQQVDRPDRMTQLLAPGFGRRDC